MKSKKSILLPVEIKSREFKSKVLLSYELAKRGFRVYIGTHSNTDELTKKLKSFIFFHKSTHKKKQEEYKKRGGIFIILDEESGIGVQRSKLQVHFNHRFKTINEGNTKMMFVLGNKYLDVMKSVANLKDVELYAYGWPRVDLWRPELEKVDHKVEDLKKKHGNFFFFISSFGFTSEDQLKNYNSIIKSLHSIEINEYRYQMFLKYENMLKELSSMINPNSKIIIRPHISENADHWKRIFKNYDNIEVHDEGEVTPWLYAAEGIIQPGSTVGLQASLAGLPTVQYRLEDIPGITDSVVYELSYNAQTTQELYDFLQTNKGYSEQIKQDTLHIVKDEIGSLEGETASYKIAKKLYEINLVPMPSVRLSLQFRFINFIKLAKHYFEPKIRHYLGLEPSLYRSHFEKLENGIREEEVEEQIQEFKKIYEDDTQYIVKQIGKDLVTIETRE